MTIFATNLIKGLDILYHIALRLYYTMTCIAGLFNKKASLFYNGRKGLLEKIRQQVKSDDPIVWFHCASVGEFEQGRPVIESYRKHNPSHKILLTFFSPSGYELRKNYPLADWVFYLPMDIKRNAVNFIDAVNPSMAIFIKYEYWFNYLFELKRRGIPTYVASAIFLPNQRFFKWYGGIFRSMLKTFTHIFVQDEASAELLKKIGINCVTVSGDTRFDRVSQVTQANVQLDRIRIFAEGFPCWVAGSTWPADEDMISAIFGNLPFNKLIIAPHEVHKRHIDKICAAFSSYRVIKYSQIMDSEIDAALTAKLKEARILIIDTIGILSSTYKYGSFAYIGGGFGTGIHNTLEAATYGIPVMFGPKYKRFREAVDLVRLGGAKSVTKIREMDLQTKQFLLDYVMRNKCGSICKEYIQNNVGATECVTEHLLLKSK